MHKIICLTFVPDNPSADLKHELGISAEEQTKCFALSFMDTPQNSFIGNFKRFFYFWEGVSQTPP